MHLTRLPGLQRTFHGDDSITSRSELDFPRVGPGELAERALDSQVLAVEVDGDALGHGNWSLADTRLLGFDAEHALGRLQELARGGGIAVDE